MPEIKAKIFKYNGYSWTVEQNFYQKMTCRSEEMLFETYVSFLSKTEKRVEILQHLKNSSKK